MDVQAHIDRLLEALPELAAAEIQVRDPRAHAALCTKVSQVIAGLQTLRSRMLAEGARAEVPQRLGATSMGALVSRAHGGDRREADAAVRQGATLQTLPTTHRAAGLGELTPRQASLIAATIHGLPAHLDTTTRRSAEEHLIAVARRQSLRGLRTACDRIASRWLATEREVDIAEGEILASREEQARQTAEFSMIDTGDGTHKGWFVIPDAQASILRTALEAISAPRRDHLNGFEDRPSYRHRLGQAFTALCDHLPIEALPQNGGLPARVIVKLDYAALTSGRGIAELADGTRLSASAARIMAAGSGLIPAVLGGASTVLDLGRSQRLFSESQRLALNIRDAGCTFPDCDRPPSWCETHHAAQAWAQGGPTDLANGTLLCWHHHRHVESHGWTFRLRPDDTVAWTDPASPHTPAAPRGEPERPRPGPGPERPQRHRSDAPLLLPA